MKTLDIVHPAAKALVDISLSQDAEVGDGTTTVVLLAAEFLAECKHFVEEGVHPQAIIRAYRQAAQLAVAKVKEMAIPIGGKGPDETRELLTRCAQTSLNSKLVSGERDFFADMVVRAVMTLDPASLDLRMLGIKKVQGGGLRDSFLVDGVAFKKTFSYAGFEMQPKSYHVRRETRRAGGRGAAVCGAAGREAGGGGWRGLAGLRFGRGRRGLRCGRGRCLLVAGGCRGRSALHAWCKPAARRVANGTARLLAAEGASTFNAPSSFPLNYSHPCPTHLTPPPPMQDPPILLLNIELELKSERDNAEVRVEDPSQYQSIVDAEWNIIYDKLERCAASGAKIVLSRLAIGDLATQFFADRDIFCAGRVSSRGRGAAGVLQCGCCCSAGGAGAPRQQAGPASLAAPQTRVATSPASSGTD